MPRNDLLLRVIAAVVGITALALAAATIHSPIDPGGSSGAGGGNGGDSGAPPPPPPPSGGQTGGDLPAFLEYLVYAVAILTALALAWYLITHRREAVRTIAVAFVLAFVLALVAYAVTQLSLPEAGNATPESGIPGFGNGSGDPGTPGGDVDRTPTPIGPLLTVLAAVTAIFVGALLLSGDADEDEDLASDPDPDPDADPAPDAGHAAAVGAAAGRAADRIEATEDVDNEVYRAWREMTDLLSVPRPETSTPGEFATAAVEAGLDPDHVGELTRLFEDVRYGHEETTAEMESRAVAVLERIEAAYADDAGDGR